MVARISAFFWGVGALLWLSTSARCLSWSELGEPTLCGSCFLDVDCVPFVGLPTIRLESSSRDVQSTAHEKPSTSRLTGTIMDVFGKWALHITAVCAGFANEFEARYSPHATFVPRAAADPPTQTTNNAFSLPREVVAPRDSGKNAHVHPYDTSRFKGSDLKSQRIQSHAIGPL